MGEAFTVDLMGEAVPVTVRRNARAKRLILRVSKATGDVTLTLPPRASKRMAERFISEHTHWLEKELGNVTKIVPLGAGDQVPFLGDVLTLEYTGAAPRTVWLDEESLIVGGPVDMAAIRLENWFKKQAKLVLSERASHYADKLGVSYKRISIGDMKSRWGSCSESGTLRFNWRLVMAPFEVLDYVAAHEVAHLREMNHSERFWAHVAHCVPDHKVWRRWLKKEGNNLFHISFAEQ